MQQKLSQYQSYFWYLKLQIPLIQSLSATKKYTFYDRILKGIISSIIEYIMKSLQ